MRTALLAVLLLATLATVGCSTAPQSASDRAELVREARISLKQFKQINPEMYKAYNDSSVGVAVFPTVGKGAIGVGGAYGKGVLFENDQVAGYCDLTQASIGFQLGGQAYTEIIYFKDEPSLKDLKRGVMEFAAQASAVAVKADASANANYDNGVAVFTLSGKGLMYEASLGGQEFSYVAKEDID